MAGRRRPPRSLSWRRWLVRSRTWPLTTPTWPARTAQQGRVVVARADRTTVPHRYWARRATATTFATAPGPKTVVRTFGRTAKALRPNRSPKNVSNNSYCKVNNKEKKNSNTKILTLLFTAVSGTYVTPAPHPLPHCLVC